MVISKNNDISHILTFDHELSRAHTPGELVEFSLKNVITFFLAQRGSLVLVNAGVMEFQLCLNQDGQPDEIPQDQISHTLLDLVLSQRQGRLMNSILEDGSGSNPVGFSSQMCVPLLARELLLGAILVEKPGDVDPYTDDDLHWLEVLAAQIAVHYALLRAHDQLEQRIAKRTQELQTSLDDLEKINKRLVETNYHLRREIVVRQDLEYELVKLSQAVEQSPSTVMITDLDGKIEYVNPRFSEMTGFMPDEALGKTPKILRSDLTPRETYQELWQALSEGRVWRGEFINRKKNGELYWESSVIAPVIGREGRISHFVAIKDDISDRKALEKLRDDLTHSLVHDLRNPLTAINTSMHLLKKNQEEQRTLSDDYNEILDTAYASGQRMMTLINAILDVTRLENHQLALNIRPVGVFSLLKSVVQAQASIAKLYEVEIFTELPENLPEVDADPDMLKRICQNLLDNALKFSPKDGRIIVSGEYQNEKNLVKISVRDTGAGIEPGMETRLFQKFAIGSSRGSGSGLGLAFCRLAVEAHGGQIWGQNHAEGGAVFTFTLPASQTDALTAGG